MIRHATTEDLSAFLDNELGFAEAGQLEAHCETCAECGPRLAAMRRVVHGLGLVGRAAPPPDLRLQIRREVLKAPARGRLATALDSLRFFLFPMQPALRASSVLGLAVMAGLFAVIHGFSERALYTEPRPHPVVENVETSVGAPFTLPPTTSEVAGRKFVWTDAGWVQSGLEGKTPVALVDARSPEGREMLTRYSDLELLMADGSSVVLRYNLETVEIRGAASPANRVMGYDTDPRPGRNPFRTLSA